MVYTFSAPLVFDEVQQMIDEVHMGKFVVRFFCVTDKMINVPNSLKSQDVPLSSGVKNTTITKFYIVKESFYREVKQRRC